MSDKFHDRKSSCLRIVTHRNNHVLKEGMFGVYVYRYTTAVVALAFVLHEQSGIPVVKVLSHQDKKRMFMDKR